MDTQKGAGFTSNGDAVLGLALVNAPYSRFVGSTDLGATWTEETLPEEWAGAGPGCVASADGLVYGQETCLGSCSLCILSPWWSLAALGVLARRKTRR